MTNNTRNINNIYYIFIISHLIFWTLVPYLTNHNLPLDTTLAKVGFGLLTTLDFGFDTFFFALAVFGIA